MVGEFVIGNASYRASTIVDDSRALYVAGKSPRAGLLRPLLEPACLSIVQGALTLLHEHNNVANTNPIVRFLT